MTVPQASVPRDKSGNAWLTDTHGERIVLDPMFKVGRSDRCSLCIRSNTVSREHALILQDGDGTWRISDLGSTNGTFLNGRKVVLSQVLRAGDKVTFGSMGPQYYTFHQVDNLADAYSPQGDEGATVVATEFERTWILVADIVGSTRLIQHWGPDVYRDTLDQWAGECRKVIESCGGVINKFIGDAFLAYWLAGRSDPGYVAGALNTLLQMQARSGLPFRMLVHLDNVAFGGRMHSGEESLWGPPVNFIFKAERVASTVRAPIFVTGNAAAVLQRYFQLQDLGEYEVPGFTGAHKFYTLQTAD